MEKVCLGCREIFTTNRSKRKYCSQKCYHKSKKMSNEVVVQCDCCGKSITRTKSRVNDTKNYCNKECSNMTKKGSIRNKKIEKICKCCGNTYFAKVSNSEFCSRYCSTTYYNERKDRFGRCDRCSEWIHYRVNYNRAYDFIYCNRCRGEIKTIESLIILNCDYCNKEFKRKKSRIVGLKNYCSATCQQSDSIEKVKRQCAYCGNDVWRKWHEFKNYQGSGEKKNVYCNIECMGNHYSKEELFAGENSPTWLGGKPKSYGTNWPSQRKKALKRDGYKCQDCGISNEDYKFKTGIGLAVHHIVPYRFFNEDWVKANELSNLVSLCEPCHKLAHRNLKNKQ